jgi:hypothetical protein
VTLPIIHLPCSGIPPTQGVKLGSPPEGGFHFITEMFFNTFYAIHVGIIPAISQYTNFISLYQQTNTQVQSLKAKFGEGKK